MSTAPASTLPPVLPVPSSLRAAAQAADQLRQPLVVMVTLKGCAFCDVVRNSHLVPMYKRGEVQVVQIDMLDRKSTLQNLQGVTTTPYEQARQWKVTLAPTLLFINSQGQELAERLEGVGVADFYGAYLEQRLETARHQTHRP
jgi:thioredoxin-related protein